MHEGMSGKVPQLSRWSFVPQFRPECHIIHLGATNKAKKPKWFRPVAFGSLTRNDTDTDSDTDIHLTNRGT